MNHNVSAFFTPLTIIAIILFFIGLIVALCALRSANKRKEKK